MLTTLSPSVQGIPEIQGTVDRTSSADYKAPTVDTSNVPSSEIFSGMAICLVAGSLLGVGYLR